MQQGAPARRLRAAGTAGVSGPRAAAGLAVLAVLTAGLLALAAGCASGPRRPAVETAPAEPPPIRYGLDRPLPSLDPRELTATVPESVSVQADRWTHFALGYQAEMSGNCKLALQHYARAAESEANDPELLARQAACQHELLHHKEAARIARRVLDLDPDHTEALWTLGTSLVALGQLGEALGPLTDLHELHPSRRNHRLLANIYERMQRYEEALEHVDALVRMTPGSPHLLERRGGLLLRLGRPEEALEDYWTILEISPEFPGNIENIVAILQRLGREDELLRLYRTLAERLPRLQRPRWKLIEILLSRGEWDQAEEQLRTLRRLHPEEGLPALQLGLIAYRRGDAETALDLVDEALELGVDPTLAWRWKMRIHFAEDDCRRALSAADSLVDVDSSDVEGWRIRALCLAEMGRHDEALRSAEYWGAIDEEAVEPLLLGAAICREQGSLERGLTLLQTAREREPQETSIALELAAMLDLMDRSADAQRIVEEILEREPDSPAALNFLGYMWVEQGIRLAEAEKLIARALTHEPENPAFLDSLGWLWYKRGDLDRAEKYLRQAVEKGGRHPEIFAHLAEVQVQQGRPEEATKTLEAGLQWSPENRELREFLLSLEGER